MGSLRVGNHDMRADCAVRDLGWRQCSAIFGQSCRRPELAAKRSYLLREPQMLLRKIASLPSDTSNARGWRGHTG